MILASLARYYDTLLEKGDVTDPGWGAAKVSYGLHLGQDGSLKAVTSLMEEVTAGKKQVLRQRVIRNLPEPAIRTVSIAANFLCDTSSYLLGVDAKGKPQRTQLCFEAGKALHLALLADVSSPAAQAIVRFFETWQPAQAGEHPALAPQLEDITSGGNLVFFVDLAYAHEDPAIRAAWQRHRDGREGTDGMVCLVTGERGPVAVLHPKIKGVLGAQSSGAALVSFNARAFESYGREDAQGLNAPVGERATYAYTTALNRLLADPRHRVRMGDTTVVFWSEDDSDTAAELFSINLAPPSATDSEAESPDALLDAVFTKLARLDPIDNVNIDCPFYVLGLAPNAARVSVRFFLRERFGTLLERLRAHYDRLDIARAPYEAKYLRMPELLDALANPNATVKQPPALAAGAMLRAILSGGRYPATMFATAMMRIRAEQDDKKRRIQKISRARAAIIKAYLLKNGSDTAREVCKMGTVNPDIREPGYLLGRLFSLLEQTQSASNEGRDINATIKDRYFNAAMTTPQLVFPTLLKLANNHLRKIKNKAQQVYLEKQIGELVASLGDMRAPDTDPPAPAFPPRLTQEQQGFFIEGYYLQNQARYTKKETDAPQQNKEDAENG